MNEQDEQPVGERPEIPPFSIKPDPRNVYDKLAKLLENK